MLPAQGNDATFSKFQSLHAGDAFVDPSRRRLQDAAASRAQNVAPAPFKPISPMKRSTGPGDFQGTLAGKQAYVPGLGVTGPLPRTRADNQVREPTWASVVNVCVS
jgi:hypothetical protein